MKRGIGGSRELYRREIANPEFIKIYDDCINGLPECINALRINAGYTLEDLANMLGLSHQSVSDRIHKRTQFEIAEIFFLAMFFHVTVYDLLQYNPFDENDD